MPEFEFQQIVDDITNTRAQIAETLSNISIEKEALRLDQDNLNIAIDTNQDATSILASIDDHNVVIGNLTTQYNDFVAIEDTLVGQLHAYYPAHQDLVSFLDDSVPILFFPVRIETTFKNEGGQNQLWVRIFPDDIEMQSHEPLLTENEFEEGKRYWDRYSAATTQLEKVQAWNLLCEGFKHQRAAWIALQTNPSITSHNPKTDSWTEQPFTHILPDAFVIKAYSYSGSTFTKQTNKVPDRVNMGLDPKDDDVFDQVNGEITARTDVEWMVDFDAAIAKGLGAKINIDPNSAAQGFARIVVMGVKISLNKEASQARLEGLIDSHHYTDGFSLLKQGTSVNNTDDEYSGYSSVDFGNNVTHATEREADLFTPTVFNRQKKDGQILCEALGIEYDPLYHIYQANGVDIYNAMNMNNALWSSTWGYYFTNMMCPVIDGDTTEQLRQFFLDYVYCRGALPSIRSGIQPYGILPTTVYSRMVWGADPSADLYRGIYDVVSSLGQSWETFAAELSYSGNEGLTDILAQSPVSVNRVFRVGLGPGYVWNNLVFSRPEGAEETAPNDWMAAHVNKMNAMQTDTGLDLNIKPRIAQMNFSDSHFTVSKPLVAPEFTNKNAPLPEIVPGINYLTLLGQATFEQLKFADYSAYEIDDVPDISLLYLFVRQSLMLEYYTAACNLLGIPDADRVDPEFINMPVGDGQGIIDADPNTFKVYAGGSRWATMEQSYGGYATISEFLDSPAAVGLTETSNLFSVKNSVMELAVVFVGDLELLTAEVMDSATVRLDTWRLSLINQRINVLRGITDGSGSRNKGIYIGAYSWVEDVKRKGTRSYLQANEPTPNFSGPIEKDTSNQGFIHAPSINQAVTAAVLRSGYMTRAESSASSPLSVNISSERVRYAEQILEGVKNGQNLPTLLGYEFERRLQDNYPYISGPTLQNTSRLIYPIRNKYPLKNTVTPYDNTQNNVEDIKARSVVNALQIIDDYKVNGINTVVSNLAPSPSPLEIQAIENEIVWIWNLMDAVSDLSTAEGVFQMIQGNQVKSGAITDAISKGNNMSDIELINTPKTGTAVYQRFTLHLDTTLATPAGWSTSATARAVAEPYLNKWIGEILGDPSNISCSVKNVTTNVVTEVTLADLYIQPLDLVHVVNANLSDDDSELSLRIKRLVRNAGALKEEQLEVQYDNNATATFSISQVFPIIQCLKKLITNCRHLKTQDYLQPNEADGVANIYDLQDFYDRLIVAANAFNGFLASLNTANTNLIPSSTPTQFDAVREALFAFSAFGLDNTIYEYRVLITNDSADYSALKNLGASVYKDASNRYGVYGALALNIPNPSTSTIDNSEDFINKCLDAFKVLFGKEINVLPLFSLDPSVSKSNLSYLVNNNLGTLKADHESPNPVNNYIVDEWLCSIAKVRKNSANYEMLAMLGSGINMSSFITERELIPMQIPYASDNTERWLGTSVIDQAAIKSGRVSFGISVPKPTSGIFDITSDGQVGLMIDEWIDMIPNKVETTGVAFHFNQPNNKAPQCLLLGLTPQITGNWNWTDIEDMINETFDFAKQRAFTYDALAPQNNSITQFAPALVMPVTLNNTTIGFTLNNLVP